MKTKRKITLNNHIIEKVSNMEVLKHYTLLISFLGIISLLVLVSSCDNYDEDIKAGKGSIITKNIKAVVE